MNAPISPNLMAPQKIEFKLNDQTVLGFEGESILNAAKRNGVDIPHLCYKEGMRADGNCRACVVEIKGERTLAPSCCRNVSPGLEVSSQSLRAQKSQEMVSICSHCLTCPTMATNGQSRGSMAN
jgi:formate dehydrogenase major subunit